MVKMKWKKLVIVGVGIAAAVAVAALLSRGISLESAFPQMQETGAGLVEPAERGFFPYYIITTQGGGAADSGGAGNYVSGDPTYLGQLGGEQGYYGFVSPFTAGIGAGLPADFPYTVGTGRYIPSVIGAKELAGYKIGTAVIPGEVYARPGGQAEILGPRIFEPTPYQIPIQPQQAQPVPTADPLAAVGAISPVVGGAIGLGRLIGVIP